MSEWWDCENGHANQILYQTPYRCESCDALYDGTSGYSVDDGLGDPCEEELMSCEADPPPKQPHRARSQPGCPEGCAGPHLFSVAVETGAHCLVGEEHTARAHVDPLQPGFYEWSVVGDAEFDGGFGGTVAGEDLTEVRFLPSPGITQQLTVQLTFHYGEEQFHAEGYVDVDALQLSIEAEPDGVYGEPHVLEARRVPDTPREVTWSLVRGEGRFHIIDDTTAKLLTDPVPDFDGDWETITVKAACQVGDETFEATREIDFLLDVGSLAGLDDLKGNKDPDAPKIEYDDETLRRNTVDGSTPLPWTGGGWDAQELLSKLGQYDRSGRTDSDGSRCVQATALASHILSGPGATAAFLRTSRGAVEGTPSKRQRAAMNILSVVAARISAKAATYGDLSWAQEALHALYMAEDDSGTPEGKETGVIVPEGDENALVPMDRWYTSVPQLQQTLSGLAPGEQLICMTWTVTFNTTFDQLEEMAMSDPSIVVEDRMQVNIEGKGEVWIERIDTSTKPRPDQIDRNRDQLAGHQLMLHKGADGGVYLYDPETVSTGDHNRPAQRAVLDDYLEDRNASFGMYKYLRVKGKVVPAG